jgi:hypothetical protein
MSVRPLLALAPVRKRRIDAIAIVDGTLVPTRDHRLAAPSKNYRYSANVQVAIDANTRLVIATGDAHPGNRNDCTVYRDSGIERELAGRPVMADGGYQGNPEVIMPYRKPRDGGDLPDWKEDLNAGHRKIRARVEHALTRMKCWKFLRDYRRAASTLNDTVSGIAHLHNILGPRHGVRRGSAQPRPAGGGPAAAGRRAGTAARRRTRPSRHPRRRDRDTGGRAARWRHPRR